MTGAPAQPAPRVSVVVPHYNDLERLDRCLAALSAQTMPRDQYEIIVADNNSPVGLAAVEAVVAGRARITVAMTPGAGPARNAGAEVASGEILAFTDSDCVPEPQWLEQGVAALGHEGDFIGGGMKVLVPQGRPMTGAEAFETVFAFDNERYVRQLHFTVTANLLCPSALFRKVGPFRTDRQSRLTMAQREDDARAAALLHQHVDDLPRRAIAEQLSQRLFVPGDAMPLDQREEILRRIAPQRGLGEMRVGGEIAVGSAMDVGEVAAPAAGDQDLLARRIGMIDQQHAPAAPARR